MQSGEHINNPLTQHQEALVQAWLRLPWTVERTDEDDGSFSLRIAELPGFIIADDIGTPDDTTEENFWDALTCFLESYAEDDETPPLPERKPLWSTVIVRGAQQ